MQKVAETNARPNDMRLTNATYKDCLATSRNCFIGDDR